MHRTALLPLLLLAAGCAGGNPYRTALDEKWSHYGADVSGDAPAMTTAAIESSPPSGPIVMAGTIRGVCQTKGCWMQLVPDGEVQPVFVKFKDYSFFVPRNAAGRYAVIHGTPVVSEVSVEMLRHYASDAGKTQTEILAITQPERRLEFVADSVLIQGGGLQPPYVAPTPENCEPPPSEGEAGATPPGDGSVDPAAPSQTPAGSPDEMSRKLDVSPT